MAGPENDTTRLRFSGVYSFLHRFDAIVGTIANGAIVYNGASMHTILETQGLSDNSILCITKDTKGFIWMGTIEGGINKFIPK